MTCLPLLFACNSVINTLKAFCFCNSLCGGGRVNCLPFHKAFHFCAGDRVTCLPLPFASNSAINTHIAVATDFAEEAA